MVACHGKKSRSDDALYMSPISCNLVYFVSCQCTCRLTRLVRAGDPGDLADQVGGDPHLATLPPRIFFFFLSHQFITRGLLAVRGRHIQTLSTLRLRYAVPVMYYQNLGTSFWRANAGQSPRIFQENVALSSGEKVETPQHRSTHTVASRQIALGRSPDRNPTQRSGQSPEGVDSP
jgi:hypothetical protein